MSKLDRIAVVGASLSGLRSVQALRRLGHAGDLIAIGEEPHRPYDRPPLSKEVLAGKWEPERTNLWRDSDEALDVDWRFGVRARSLDLARREVQLADGDVVAYDGLVIATGAVARRLPGTEGLAGVHVLRTLDDALALRAALDANPRVAIVGAGFIGLEVAATCRERGLDVCVVEALPVPLERALEPEMGRLIADLHRDHGVDLRVGQGVERFVVDGAAVRGIELADGARIDADVVVVGIGARPATDWLEGSGLTLDDGVVCDAYCFAAPGVVAVGDVARWSNPLFDETMRVEHWTHATEQADAAAANLLAADGEAQPFAPAPFFWSDQYDRKIQFAGRMRPGDQGQLVDGSIEERRFVKLYTREGRIVGVFGMNRPRLVMKYRRMIRERAILP